MKNKKDFPQINDNFIYLDSTATSLTPLQVTDAMNEYYHTYCANIHRGIYSTSIKATEMYEKSRQIIASFINAKFTETIFTKNASESLNLLAYSLTKQLKKGDEIILSIMEHHSNFVPWQQLAKEKGIIIKYAKIKNFELDLNHLKSLITKKTKIIAITHVSNVLGTINPIKKIVQLAKSVNALTIIDGAQAVPHLKIDVKDLDCDFYAFSGHKMLGPTGIGVLYGKEELLDKMSPFLYGGDMISSVCLNDSKWNELPYKFEAGTPPIAQVIGLATAVKYLEKIGMDKIFEHEKMLTSYAINKLSKIKKLKLLHPKKNSIGVISFVIEGIHPHDLGTLLDEKNVAIRAGHHCAMPLITELKVGSTARASLYLYNTKKDIDELINGIKKAMEVFKL